METTKFIGLPIKIYREENKNSNHWEECEKKFDYAETMGIDPKNYCPECYQKQEDDINEDELEDSVEYVRTIDIVKFRADTESTTIVHVYDLESFFVYKVFMDISEFRIKLENLGVVIG